MAKASKASAEEQCAEVIAQNKRLFKAIEQLNVKLRDLIKERDELFATCTDQCLSYAPTPISRR